MPFHFFSLSASACLPACACLVLSGCSRPAIPPPSPSQTSGGMTVTLMDTAPHTGDNTLVVTLADASTHLPVGNANITATANMLSPSLPGPAVSGRAQGNGVYNVPVRFGIATRYRIVLHIERTGHAPADVSFPLEAAQ